MTTIAASDKYTPPMATFCTVRVSAVGPPRIRRWTAAGFVRSK